MKWKRLTRENRPPEEEWVECKAVVGGTVQGQVWMQSNGTFHCVGNGLSSIVTHYRKIKQI